MLSLRVHAGVCVCNASKNWDIDVCLGALCIEGHTLMIKYKNVYTNDKTCKSLLSFLLSICYFFDCQILSYGDSKNKDKKGSTASRKVIAQIFD